MTSTSSKRMYPVRIGSQGIPKKRELTSNREILVHRRTKHDPWGRLAVQTPAVIEIPRDEAPCQQHAPISCHLVHTCTQVEGMTLSSCRSVRTVSFHNLDFHEPQGTLTRTFAAASQTVPRSHVLQKIGDGADAVPQFDRGSGVCDGASGAAGHHTFIVVSRWLTDQILFHLVTHRTCRATCR
jgi:hypothetical protein